MGKGVTLHSLPMRYRPSLKYPTNLAFHRGKRKTTRELFGLRDGTPRKEARRVLKEQEDGYPVARTITRFRLSTLTRRRENAARQTKTTNPVA